jgi:beta-galactosidase
MDFRQIIYGGDYNPEQWPPEVWEEDARLMQEAGVNLVSLGIFAWAKLEPAPGRYDFGWLDQVMNLLHAHDVRVNLGTATASPPPWLAHQHPDILPVTVDSITLWHGSRRHYCPHSQAYREAAGQLVTHLAQHAREHPALALWHVDNEYACGFSECFCDASVDAFRQWLEKRYGTLDTLNEAWGTAFWGQIYSDWKEITVPAHAPASICPAQTLDWKRFCSDSWLACFDEQKEILRDVTPNVPITTNFMSFFKPLDYWTWAAQEDVVSNDSYPDPADPQWMIQAGMACDLMRSLGNGKPWILMEQATTQVNWRKRNAAKRPGQMRLGSYQALARGANGVMFFQWRASQAGSEKFHSAMLPHAGTDSRVWREVKSLGQELPRLAPLLSSQVHAEAAILFDWENWWALEQSDKPLNDLALLELVSGWYAEFFRRNISVDFVHPESDLSRYRLVVMPSLYLVSEGAILNIERYVVEGGFLLATFFSGIVDGSDRVRPGGYPGPFHKLLGLQIEEFAPQMEQETNSIVTIDENEFACDLWSEVIHAADAEVLAQFQQDYLTGGPALTCNLAGQGRAYYLATRLGADGVSWLVDRLCAEAGLKSVLDAPAGVEVTRRGDGKRSWLFVLNHSSEAVEVRLPKPGIDLLAGAPVKSSLYLGPKGIAVVQLEEE